MRLVWVQTDYLSAEQWEALDWQALRAAWPSELPEEKPKNQWGFAAEKARLTYDELDAVAALGVQMKVLPPTGMMTVKMQDRATWDHDVSPADIANASAVQIAVPDMALMYIDEVRVVEDYCTDALQSELDDGWRILAICPPNAARRPDYIIGRRKPSDPFDRNR